MVTGDQPPTAAAIAHKVNIISDPTLEYFTMIRKGMSPEEAWSRCYCYPWRSFSRKACRIRNIR
jgi:magnesium-transporting ATPase (P-type)